MRLFQQEGIERNMDSNKNPNQKLMHASLEGLQCKLCNKVFNPKRKNQVFCCPSCRLRYFDLGRRIGVVLIENIKKDKAIIEFLIKRVHE